MAICTLAMGNGHVLHLASKLLVFNMAQDMPLQRHEKAAHACASCRSMGRGEWTRCLQR